MDFLGDLIGDAIGDKLGRRLRRGVTGTPGCAVRIVDGSQDGLSQRWRLLELALPADRLDATIRLLREDSR